MGVLILAGILGPLLTPYSPNAYDLTQSTLTPSPSHPMGTDENGRDIFSRILAGARISLGIGFAVIVLSGVAGISIGLVVGYFGGWYEKSFVAVADVFQAFPGILLSIAVAAFLPPGILNVILLLSFVGWVSYARVTRAQVLALKKKEFVEAARMMGAGFPRICKKHLLPNIAGPLIIQSTFGMAGVILTESTLSFLGLGIPITAPSWGRMLDSGSSLLLVAPHLSIFPGLAILFSVLTFNLLGDRLRDRLAARR